MSYLDTYLEPCPAYGWTGGSEFQTREVSMASGWARYNAEWSQEKIRVSTNYLNIDLEAQRQIRKVFRVCRGRLHAFRFRDELDYEAVDEVIATGDGATREFQLSASFTEDGETYTRNVYAIISAAVTVDDIAASPTIDLRRGKITFASAPAVGAVIRWSGIFDIWVRFAQDYLPFSLDNPNATNGSIELIEQPPPAVGDD